MKYELPENHFLLYDFRQNKLFFQKILKSIFKNSIFFKKMKNAIEMLLQKIDISHQPNKFCPLNCRFTKNFRKNFLGDFLPIFLSIFF